MTTQEQTLSAEQKDVLAVGASVGAVAGDEPGEGCVWRADAETDEAPVTADVSVAETGRHAAGCGTSATQSAASDLSRAMVGRSTSAVSEAETDNAPAATTATGGCRKEA